MCPPSEPVIKTPGKLTNSLLQSDTYLSDFEKKLKNLPEIGRKSRLSQKDTKSENLQKSSETEKSTGIRYLTTIKLDITLFKYTRF